MMRESVLKKSRYGLYCLVALAFCCFVFMQAKQVEAKESEAWDSFWGGTSGIWYEGAYGELKDVSDTGFTAFYEMIGWGGVWGCQVYNDSIDMRAGGEYEINANIESDDIDKWIFIKITNTKKEKEEILWGKWIHLVKGKTYHLQERFVLYGDANRIIFAMGGEFGDRVDEEDIYALSDILPNDADGGIESDAYTTIRVWDFHIDGWEPTDPFIASQPKVSVKVGCDYKPVYKKIKNMPSYYRRVYKRVPNSLKVKVGKLDGQKGVTIRYKKLGTKKWTVKRYKTTKAISQIYKGLKKNKKYVVQVRAYKFDDRNEKVFSKWSDRIIIKLK